MPLIDSDTWESKSFSINQLEFHPANPRFSAMRSEASEREIVEELCLRGNVEHLAKQITEKGYLRQDRLVVFIDGGKKVVYEGNRRLCALKVLKDPTRAPVSMQRLFKRLAEKAKLPSKIAVEVVPTRFDAEVVMFSKHAAENFTVDWKPIQQAAFIVSRLEHGESIDAVAKTCGLSRLDVVQARAALDLYRLARIAPLSPKAKLLVDNPSTFPYSTVFERLVIPQKSRAELGVDITDAGLVVHAAKDSFLSGLAQVISDAAEGKVDTRKLNGEVEQVDYARSLKIKVGTEKFTAESLEAEKKGGPLDGMPKIVIARASITRSVKPSSRVFPRTLISTYGHEKIERLLNEGKKLEVADAPHAGAFLIRSVLEISATLYLKASRHWAALHKSVPKKPFGPSLADLLDYLNTHGAEFNFDTTCKSVLEALVARKVKHSKADLDRIVHTPEAIATEESVIQIRELAVPLLEILLKKP